MTLIFTGDQLIAGSFTTPLCVTSDGTVHVFLLDTTSFAVYLYQKFPGDLVFTPHPSNPVGNVSSLRCDCVVDADDNIHIVYGGTGAAYLLYYLKLTKDPLNPIWTPGIPEMLTIIQPNTYPAIAIDADGWVVVAGTTSAVAGPRLAWRDPGTGIWYNKYLDTGGAGYWSDLKIDPITKDIYSFIGTSSSSSRVYRYHFVGGAGTSRWSPPTSYLLYFLVKYAMNGILRSGSFSFLLGRPVAGGIDQLIELYGAVPLGSYNTRGVTPVGSNVLFGNGMLTYDVTSKRTFIVYVRGGDLYMRVREDPISAVWSDEQLLVSSPPSITWACVALETTGAVPTLHIVYRTGTDPNIFNYYLDVAIPDLFKRRPDIFQSTGLNYNEGIETENL